MFSLKHQAQNLILHLKCNRDSKDYSQFGNDGQIIGGVESTSDRFGNQCGAFKFNGIDGFIEIPNSSSLEKLTRKMSVSFWYKLANPNNIDALNWLTVMCKGLSPDETSSNPQFRFQTFQSNKQSTISINSEFTEFDQDYFTHFFEFDKWCFYTLTWDGILVECFVNTKKIWEFPYNGILVSNQDPLHIGKDIPGNTEFYLGDLDDIRLYDGKLSTQKMIELYNDQTEADFEEDFTLKCPKDINKNTDYGKCTAMITYADPIVMENCGTTSLRKVSGLNSGSNFPIGTSFVKYEAVNTFNLKKTCSFKITVEENSSLSLVCPNDTNLVIDQGTEITYTYLKPTITNKCSTVSISLVNGIDSGGAFPLGSTTNTYEAINLKGTKATCSFKVNVILKDTTPIVSKIKKDSILVAPVKPSVTLPEIPTKVKEYEALGFKNDQITVLIYDNKEEDNDTISIFYNDEEIIYREMLKLRKNKPTIKYLDLKNKKDNEFVIKAWNVGKIPPNTLKIEFYEGHQNEDDVIREKVKPVFVKSYSSDPKIGAKIILNQKQ
jgi:hypothetical protein